jgi:hypothetical protein
MLGVHPDGQGSRASGEQLAIGFGPNCPDFAAIGVAASDGWAWGTRVGVGELTGRSALEKAIEDAVNIVIHEKRCAILDCVLDSI